MSKIKALQEQLFQLNETDPSLPYHITYNIEQVRQYNPQYGDSRKCVCGHSYYRHFDSYENNSPVGCKYCQCFTFEELITPSDVLNTQGDQKVYLENFQDVYHEAVRILGYYQLEDIMSYLNSTMNTSRDAPYHNLFHTCCMIINCHEGHLKNLPADRPVKYDSHEEHRLLLIAAAFHDYNHSAGILTDYENIQMAIKFARRYFESHFDHVCDTLWTEDNLKIVEDIIHVTQYPFIHTPTTLAQKVIRDADLLQCYEPAWFEHVILGLRAEFSHRMGDIPVSKMLEGQITFLNGVEFFTNRWFEESKGPWSFMEKKIRDKMVTINDADYQ